MNEIVVDNFAGGGGASTGIEIAIGRSVGFPADYIIDVDADGKPYPKSEQVARCGNAVCPPIPTALVRANLPELCEGGMDND